MMRAIIVFNNPKAENQQSCHIGLGVTGGNAAEVLVEHGIHAEAVAVIDGYYLREKLHAHTWQGLTHIVMCTPF